MVTDFQVSPQSMSASETGSRSTPTPGPFITAPLPPNRIYSPAIPSSSSSQHPFALHNHLPPPQNNFIQAPPGPNGSGKCCGAATTCTPTLPERRVDIDNQVQVPVHSNPKRTRYESPYRSETPQFVPPSNQNQRSEMSSVRIADWRTSYQQNQAPMEELQATPINGDDCCLGVVKCNERGEIVG